MDAARKGAVQIFGVQCSGTGREGKAVKLILGQPTMTHSCAAAELRFRTDLRMLKAFQQLLGAPMKSESSCNIPLRRDLSVALAI